MLNMLNRKKYNSDVEYVEHTEPIKHIEPIEQTHAP